ncbi:hypothetical protein [Microbacterium hydrocarbonoxydans]|uniref:hypothetical protein n=1 Tax=Microbacterium hydrocarbonoxydans TaxID=273678 RepID=UPI0007BC7D9D|nr:hypothetical protein [Microbacterium hydrocarbonoxydans]GAT74217.1 hypothetical protein MHM582_2718 [Microbacterium sp. HM58-2]
MTDTALLEVPAATRPRWGLAGAVYDLVVTVGFATPFTAPVLLGATRWIHDALGLPGARLPEFDAAAVMFVSLFGTVVTMWAIARILRPAPVLIAIDTAGRAAFALWMTWALLNGQSTTVVVFLIGEVLWLVLQFSGLWRLRRR